MDAEAIGEAAQRPNKRFVTIKRAEQQDIQAIHRMRCLVVERRTAQVNHIRGLLLEYYGIAIPPGRAAVVQRRPMILEDAENGLSVRCRAELSGLAEELRHLDARVTHSDEPIKAIAQNDARVQRLMTIPGLGAKGATALVAAVGEEPRRFKNGHGLAAWLSLVPRQHTTGGRERRLGISQRGESYRRQVRIPGARAVLRWVERKDDPMSGWARPLKARHHANVAAARASLSSVPRPCSTWRR